MRIFAKFKVDALLHTEHGTQITMQPVRSDDPNHINKRYWDATPSGKVEMYMTNRKAAKAFKVGSEYELSFKPVEPDSVSLGVIINTQRVNVTCNLKSLVLTAVQQALTIARNSPVVPIDWTITTEDGTPLNLESQLGEAGLSEKSLIVISPPAGVGG